MRGLNRRAVLRSVTAGAALLALSPTARLLAQPTTQDRTFESVLTGSIIELTDSQWSFNADSHSIVEEADYTSEYVSVSNESATVEIDFVQTSMDPEDYLGVIQQRYVDSYTAFEVADSDVISDGAWFAGSAVFDQFEVSIYCEYQVGAYEEADLVIIVNSRPNAFQQNLPAAQDGILIGDFEPLLMIEASDVLSLAFPVLATVTPTETPVSGRRSQRGSSGTQTSESNNSNTTETNRRGQTQGSTSDDAYVEAVSSHRSDFLQSFDDFFAALNTFVDESVTDAVSEEAFLEMNEIALTWVTYPGVASSLTAPPELATLEGLYLTWADEISVLGTTWVDIVDGTAEVADMTAQIDVVDQADQALLAELNAL